MTEAGKQALQCHRDALNDRLVGVLANRFTPAEIKALMVAAPLIERLGEGRW